MDIVRKISITVTHTDMAPPDSLVWDVRYRVKSLSMQTPDWDPTAFKRTPMQRLNFLQSDKQRADAKKRAFKPLCREVENMTYLVRETDNVGRKTPRI